MGDYKNSVDSVDVARRPATVYGPLPTHGRNKIAVVLHTTETRGVPSFNEGDTAPHYSYEVESRRWIMWAEPSAGYVGTMRGHTTGGHSNCKAIQVEVIGYTSKSAATKAGRLDLWVGNWPDTAYDDLAAFFQWTMQKYGVEYRVTPTPDGGWKSGETSGLRMSPTEWDAFSGLTCHGAVPNNDHWDTGELDLERIHALAVPSTYRGVYNVPNVEWAHDVIDLNLELGTIVTGDNFKDDWLRDQMTDGRYWTFTARLVEALDKRYQPKGQT